MKKNVLGLLVMLLALVSCEGDQGPMGPPGKDGGGLNWHTEFFTIKPGDWSVANDGDGAYFYCERELSQITEDIYEYKNVFAYMFLYPGDFEEQTPLPYPVPFEDGEGRWQEYYSYTFAPGLITFFIRYNDFNTDLPPVGNKEYKVVINW